MWWNNVNWTVKNLIRYDLISWSDFQSKRHGRKKSPLKMQPYKSDKSLQDCRMSGETAGWIPAPYTKTETAISPQTAMEPPGFPSVQAKVSAVAPGCLPLPLTGGDCSVRLWCSYTYRWFVGRTIHQNYKDHFSHYRQWCIVSVNIVNAEAQCFCPFDFPVNSFYTDWGAILWQERQCFAGSVEILPGIMCFKQLTFQWRCTSKFFLNVACV